MVNKFHAPFPAHSLLESDLRADIVEGRLAPGEKICSESILAERYGISRGSVRVALGNLTCGGLLRKVRGSGTFVEAGVANENRQIAFLSFATALSREVFFDAGTYMPMLGEMTKFAAERQCKITVAHVGPDWEAPVCIRNREVAGVIFHGPVPDDFYKQYLAPLPNVGLQYPHRESGGSCVRLDEGAFGFQAVEHLYNLGHRRIGFVSNEIDMPISLERFFAFRAALKSFHLEFREEYCAVWQRPAINGVLPNEHSLPDYREQLAPLFAAEEPPTALICVDDWRAYCTLAALEKMQRHVSVTGGRNGNGCAFPTDITGFDFRLGELGAKAVWLLLENLSGNLPGAFTLLIPPVFLPGSTTSPVN